MHRLIARFASGALVLMTLALLAQPVEAQRLTQYSRATVESPQVLARGGASVALSRSESAVFYNPAQLARIDLRRPRVETFAVQGTASTNFLDNIGFLTGDVRGAVEQGIGLPLTEEERALFDEAIVRGRRPAVGQAAIALPTIMVQAGGAAFAIGVHGTNTTRYRFEDIGGGVPLLDLFSQADLIASVAGAVEIPSSPLAAGATVRLAQRYLGSKVKDLLSMDSEYEALYIVSGSTMAVDLGLHAADVAPTLPGRLDLGLAVYDLLGGGFSYELDRRIALAGSSNPDDQELVGLLAELASRDGRPTVRAGAAYHFLESVPVADLAVALDWVSASTSESRQPVLAGLRLGAEAAVLNHFTVRAGVGQGYPSGGFGVRIPGASIEYALFGVEDGRLPGQLKRYSHLLQLKVGIF
jgi:hypothetical protein